MNIQSQYFGGEFEKKLDAIHPWNTRERVSLYDSEFTSMTKGVVDYTLGSDVEVEKEKALMESWNNLRSSLGNNIKHYATSSCGDSRNQRLFEDIRYGEKELQEALNTHQKYHDLNNPGYADTLKETAQALEQFSEVRGGICHITSFEPRK